MTLLPALGKAPQLLPTPVRSDDVFDLQGVETVGGLRSLCQPIAPPTEQQKQGRWASVRRLEQTKACNGSTLKTGCAAVRACTLCAKTWRSLVVT